MIRQAMENEATQCAQLLYLSGPNLFSYIYNEKGPELYRIIEHCFRSSGTTFSREANLVYESDGVVQGGIVAHSVPAIKRFAKEDINCIVRLRGGFFRSFFYLVKMLARMGIVIHYPALKDDEYFISNLAVFEEYRGQGVATRLLEGVEAAAKERGYNKLSLFVETYNDKAKKLYERFGFHEEQKKLFPKRYERFGLTGFYKMVKVI